MDTNFRKLWRIILSGYFAIIFFDSPSGRAETMAAVQAKSKSFRKELIFHSWLFLWASFIRL
jgi:hypothetical protein